MTHTDNDNYYRVKGVSHLFNQKEERGVAKLSKFYFKQADNPIFNFRNAREHPMFIVRDGEYVRLSVKGEIMMSDTGMERISNKTFINKANGRVLIAGLGIGLIIHNILTKENISEIIVIEKYKDVIDLVSPKFNDHRLKIIEADIFEWKPTKGDKFDTIYFDIWPQICVDNLSQIKTLHNRFKFYKTSDGYMDSWMKHYLQAQKRKNYY